MYFTFFNIAITACSCHLHPPGEGIGFPSGAWHGDVQTEIHSGRDFLTITQDDSIVRYNDNNKYYLWIEDAYTRTPVYTRNDSISSMQTQNAKGNITNIWDISNELVKLKSNTTYRYGVSGKSNYCDSADVSTVDYYIGEFTTGNINQSNTYNFKYVKEEIGAYIYRSPFESTENLIVDENGNNVLLPYTKSIECDDLASYQEGLENNWIKVKYKHYINGVEFTKAYVKKPLLNDTPIYKYIWPTDSEISTITSPYGMRLHPTLGVYKLHTGIDIAGTGAGGKNIYASADGIVKSNDYNAAYGNLIKIEHQDGYETWYAHMMEKSPIAVGSQVSQGDIIGKIGSTGYSTGNHLHFEMRNNGVTENPLPYIRTDGENNYFISAKNLSSINLMSEMISCNCIVTCYNKYGDLIDTLNVDVSNSSNISVPYSTEYIAFVPKVNNPVDSTIVSYNGAVVNDGSTFELSEENNVIDITLINGFTNEQNHFSTVLMKAEADTGRTLTTLFIYDTEHNLGGDVTSFSLTIAADMEITLPRSIEIIGLDFSTDNPYATVRVYKNGYYWINEFEIPAKENSQTLEIIVESETGEETRYTLKVNKESDYENDSSLNELYLATYDKDSAYLDTQIFTATDRTIGGFDENTAFIIPNAKATSDFANVSYYLDGNIIDSETPISLANGFTLMVRVTAEDGTYTDYNYTYGDVVLPLTKTTFKTTETYHKFYVSFDEAIDNATIFAAVYDEKGKLLELNKASCDGDDYYIVNVPVNQNTKKAKLFVWQNGIKPLGKAEIINMK